MATSNPLDILLTHDRWATRNILDACSKLSDEQFHQRFEMGSGSLHDTATHILAAMRGWGDLLASREPRPRLDPVERRTAAELMVLADESYDDFANLVRSHPLEDIVSRVRDGKTYSFTRGAVLTHVTTHAMHHRAQCLNMLRHVGAKPLPQSSVMEWTWTGDEAP
jgi:uncharacterized damage-inducible protein DinB